MARLAAAATGGAPCVLKGADAALHRVLSSKAAQLARPPALIAVEIRVDANGADDWGRGGLAGVLDGDEPPKVTVSQLDVASPPVLPGPRTEGGRPLWPSRRLSPKVVRFAQEPLRAAERFLLVEG